MKNPWSYRSAYIVGALILIIAEFLAIFNGISGDTITENVRNVLDVAPILWYSLLGLWIGIAIWMTRHFWWKKR